MSKLAQQIETARLRYVYALRHDPDNAHAARLELIRVVDEAIEQDRSLPRLCTAEGACE
jgi:hypothetical protein